MVKAIFCGALENRNNFKVKGTIETYPKETLDAYVDSMINHVSQKSTTIGNRSFIILLIFKPILKP